MQALEQRLGEIYRRSGPPEAGQYLETLQRGRQALAAEAPAVRPPDEGGRPGGLILLRQDIPSIIVPDIHARMELLLSVLEYQPYGQGRVLELLDAGELQVVCVGDGVHAEGRAFQRWQEALEEFKDGYRVHESMDQEMRESLGVMEMVMELKSAHPSLFHFLKGNHENIANEQGEGNYPFMKFANEGLMVLTYMTHFYGQDVFDEHYLFEKQLPLLAVGRDFLVSHAEPATLYTRAEVIGYLYHPEVIYGLTWTDNGEAEPDSVARMLEHYLGEEGAQGGYYFGGHRPVQGSYRLRADGRYVQIHDPERFVVALLPASGGIALERDIRTLPEGGWWAEVGGG
jgi:hypothetical protein